MPILTALSVVTPGQETTQLVAESGLIGQLADVSHVLSLRWAMKIFGVICG
jgi:hypothetical protein